MDPVLCQARENINTLWLVVKRLHPEYASIGTPAWMNRGTRLCFSIKLTSGSRKSTQYARLLLECRIGRVLTSSETVDHVDGDSRNNDITNLQVLSRSDNARKGPSAAVKAIVASSNRARLLGVPRPDLCGLGNGSSKLTDQQVAEIRTKSHPYVRGNDRKLAVAYGVSRELISQIRRNVLRTERAGSSPAPGITC